MRQVQNRAVENEYWQVAPNLFRQQAGISNAVKSESRNIDSRFAMLSTYSIEIEKQWEEIFNRLSEKDKSFYAGVKDLPMSADWTIKH